MRYISCFILFKSFIIWQRVLELFFMILYVCFAFGGHWYSYKVFLTNYYI